MCSFIVLITRVDDSVEWTAVHENNTLDHECESAASAT
jgi:hypothetical protein